MYKITAVQIILIEQNKSTDWCAVTGLTADGPVTQTQAATGRRTFPGCTRSSANQQGERAREREEARA